MREVLLHQSLHGYSEGHRLLETSIKLPEDVARLMLRMSDLSGSSVFPGFEEYLTGYPLLPLNFYVFAKTWYAPEMPRPGCVWTHSLVIDFKDIDQIASLGQLTKLFVRPKTSKTPSGFANGSTSYGSPVSFDSSNSDASASLSPPTGSVDFKELCNALYVANRKNLLVPGQSTAQVEDAVLKIWSQQWPALRVNFTFCTGALSARGFAGKPFDLQCAPPQLIREIITAALAKQSQTMSLLTQDKTISHETWVEEAAADAELPRGGQFRKLLWSVADGAHLEDFQTFASLIVQFLPGNPVRLRNVIALIAERFPEKSSAAALKKSFFGKDRSNLFNFQFDEWEILSELSTAPDYGAFDPETLNLRARAKLLCSDSQEDAKQLISNLFRETINPLGQEVLAGLLESITPEIARRITAQQPHFLPALFRAKPELGTSVELWRAAGDHARELFESLSSANDPTEEQITAISEAIVSSGADTLVKRALEKWGKPAVFGVLNHVASSGAELSERVAGALTFHSQFVMQWVCADVDRPLVSKVVCAHIVAPYSYQIKDFGNEVWLRTYEDLRKQEDYKEVNYLSALLLALGLQNASPLPVKVIALCFEHIHQLAWDDKIPDDNWIILDPIVPHLAWLNDWDKCERLRRGLADAFINFKWSPELLHECVRNDELLDLVLQSAKRVDGAVDYFRYAH